jgi:hypothetical protein
MSRRAHSYTGACAVNFERKTLSHVWGSDYLHDDILCNKITTAAGTAQSVWWLRYGVNDREIVVRFPAWGIFLSSKTSTPALWGPPSPLFNGYPTPPSAEIKNAYIYLSRKPSCLKILMQDTAGCLRWTSDVVNNWPASAGTFRIKTGYRDCAAFDVFLCHPRRFTGQSQTRPRLLLTTSRQFIIH